MTKLRKRVSVWPLNNELNVGLEVKTDADAEAPAEQEPQAIDDIRTVGAFANETLIDGSFNYRMFRKMII